MAWPLRMRLGRWIAGILIAAACAISAMSVQAYALNQVLYIETAEISFDTSIAPPLLGWSPATLPIREGTLDPRGSQTGTGAAWLRFGFDREKLGAGSLALWLDSEGGKFDLFLNGEQLKDNFEEAEGQLFSAARRHLVPIDDALLRHGSNVVVMKFDRNLSWLSSVHAIAVGPRADIKWHDDLLYVADFLGPLFVGAILAAMTAITLVFWANRRKERALPWLAALGLLWVLRIFEDELAGAPPAWRAFWSGHDISTFALAFVVAGFAIAYFDRKPQGRWLAAAAAAAGTAMIASYSSAAFLSNPAVTFFIIVLVAAATAALFVREFLQLQRTESAVILAAAFFALTAMLHDSAITAGFWRGIGFNAVPYAGLIAFSAFGFAVGRRFLLAVAAKENLALQLGQRIETTKANLIASESARRSLEVSNAVTQERERMMREIHDGIGSSLVAALASAERQGKSTTTAIVALKGALTDLRIAVDSLEPVEGNIATLLASLRYRVEPEMRKSAITFKWNVEDVPELDWLDSPNALHILRIFQEAFGNILGHANATCISVGCRMELCDGRPGIMIDVSDNGTGFDTSMPVQGKGRRNMSHRAEALRGRLWIRSQPGSGTTTSLWVPLLRAKV
jgi:signal transduction histidine kinase